MIISKEEALKSLDDIFNYCEELEYSLPENERSGYKMLSDILKIRKYIIENERPHGEWIFSGVEHTSDNPIDSDSYYCSVCKRSISTTLTRPEDLFPFCHCGADMREGD